ILRSSSSAVRAETTSAARRKARTRWVGSCASSKRKAMRRRAVTARASWGTAVSYPRADSYVAINTPVLVVLLSTSRSDACAPPEQKRAIPAHPFAHLGDCHLVAVRDPPAAALKPIPRVLVRAARSLHHAVKRHPIHHDYLSHLVSCSFGLGSATQMRRLGIPDTTSGTA